MAVSKSLTVVLPLMPFSFWLKYGLTLRFLPVSIFWAVVPENWLTPELLLNREMTSLSKEAMSSSATREAPPCLYRSKMIWSLRRSVG